MNAYSAQEDDITEVDILLFDDETVVRAGGSVQQSIPDTIPHDPESCVICQRRGTYLMTRDFAAWFSSHTIAGIEISIVVKDSIEIVRERKP